MLQMLKLKNIFKNYMTTTKLLENYKILGNASHRDFYFIYKQALNVGTLTHFHEHLMALVLLAQPLISRLSWGSRAQARGGPACTQTIQVAALSVKFVCVRLVGCWWHLRWCGAAGLCRLSSPVRWAWSRTWSGARAASGPWPGATSASERSKRRKNYLINVLQRIQRGN